MWWLCRLSQQNVTVLPWLQASGLCLVLLAPRTDAFYELATAAQQLQQQLEEAEVIKVGRHGCSAWHLTDTKAWLRCCDLHMLPACHAGLLPSWTGSKVWV